MEEVAALFAAIVTGVTGVSSAYRWQEHRNGGSGRPTTARRCCATSLNAVDRLRDDVRRLTDLADAGLGETDRVIGIK